MHHDRHQLIQRYQDGRLDRSQAAGLDRILDQDKDLRKDLARLGELDELLRDRPLPGGDRHDLLARIRAELPGEAPARRASMTLGQLGVLAAVLAIMVLIYGLADSVGDLVNLGLLAVLSTGLGIGFIVAARPLRALEVGLQSRLLHRRIRITGGDLMTYRAIGAAMVLGAIWLAKDYLF